RPDVVGGDARGRDRDVHLLRHAAGVRDMEAISHLRLRAAAVHEPEGLDDRAADDGGGERSARHALQRADDVARPGNAGPTAFRADSRTEIGFVYKRAIFGALNARLYTNVEHRVISRSNKSPR